METKQKTEIKYTLTLALGVLLGGAAVYYDMDTKIVTQAINQCGNKPFSFNNFDEGGITKPGYQIICRKDCPDKRP